MHETISRSSNFPLKSLYIYVCRFINHYECRRWPKLRGVTRHDRSITRDAKRALNCFRTTNDERMSRCRCCCCCHYSLCYRRSLQYRFARTRSTPNITVYIGSLTFVHFPSNISEIWQFPKCSQTYYCESNVYSIRSYHIESRF